jgi:FixJ family two-component response regulator
MSDATADTVISVIDDDPSVREGLRDLLTALGFVAAVFDSAVDFIDSGRLPDTACLIADMQLPGMSGLELHQNLTVFGITLPTILITAFPDERDRARALAAGVCCYLTKPFSETDLVACIRTALARREPQGDPA